jgi:hypothetical protein
VASGCCRKFGCDIPDIAVSVRHTALVPLPRADPERSGLRDLHAELVPAGKGDALRAVAQHVAAAEVREDFGHGFGRFVRSLQRPAGLPHDGVHDVVAPLPLARPDGVERPNLVDAAAVAGVLARRDPEDGMQHRV